jgi:hypothetical protein
MVPKAGAPAPAGIGEAGVPRRDDDPVGEPADIPVVGMPGMGRPCAKAAASPDRKIIAAMTDRRASDPIEVARPPRPCAGGLIVV